MLRVVVFPAACGKLQTVTPTDRPNAAVEEGVCRFESEGVGDLDDMVRYHGFKPEWGSYYKWNRYTLTNEDTGEVRSLSGSALASEGLSLVLDEAKTSAVWLILPE